jgi:hypothetical protein
LQQKCNNIEQQQQKSTEEIMQISKSRTTEELSRHWEDKNEDSRGLKRLYIGWNFVSKFRGKLFENEYLKTTKIEEMGPESTRACA